MGKLAFMVSVGTGMGGRGTYPRAVALGHAACHVRFVYSSGVGVVGTIDLLHAGRFFGDAVGEDNLQAEYTTTALRRRVGRARFVVVTSPASTVPPDTTTVDVLG